MARLSVGEIALARNPEGTWDECEIVEHIFLINADGERADYVIHVPSDPCLNGQWVIAEHDLRKLPHKDTPVSWEAMKDIWTPNEVSA